MVRDEDERAQALPDMAAEVVFGNLLDLDSMHRVIADCKTMYFGMSVSDACLAATVHVAAVAPTGAELVPFHPADGQSSKEARVLACIRPGTNTSRLVQPQMRL